MPTKPTNPIYWNPDHWARTRDWSSPERPDHKNAILVRDDGRELLYDAETGEVSLPDEYFAPTGTMNRGELLVTFEAGLSLAEARERFRDLLNRDIPEDDEVQGEAESALFLDRLPSMPSKDLAPHARRLFEASDDTQDELADAISSVQPEVSRALKGENQRVAKRIVEHYTGRDVEPGYIVQ